MGFAQFCLKPENLEVFRRLMNTGPWIAGAHEHISEKKARMMSTWKDNLPLVYSPDPLWVGTNLNALTDPTLSLANYREFFSSPLYSRVLGNTF